MFSWFTNDLLLRLQETEFKNLHSIDGFIMSHSQSQPYLSHAVKICKQEGRDIESDLLHSCNFIVKELRSFLQIWKTHSRRPLLGNTNISYTRRQIHSLIGASFLGLTEIDFSIGLSKNVEILYYLLAYFQQYEQRISAYDEHGQRQSSVYGEQSRQTGLEDVEVVFIRKQFSRVPVWETIPARLPELAFGDGHVDDAVARIHIHGCSQILGSGLFSQSITEEELVYLQRPETMMLLFFPHIQPNEVLAAIGAEKYSHHSGYFGSYTYAPYDAQPGEKLPNVVNCFTDPISDGKWTAQVDYIDHDIFKLYMAMSVFPGEIAISHWTYPRIGASPEVKFIAMMIAAQAAGKDINYYSEPHEKIVSDFYIWCRQNNVNLYKIFKSIKDIHQPQSVFQSIVNCV